MDVIKAKHLAIILLALTLAPASFADAGRFSGDWILDIARSEGLPPSMDISMVIGDKDPEIAVKSTLVSDSADRITEDSYILDGAEHTYKPAIPALTNATGKRTARRVDANEFDSTDHADGTSFGSPAAIIIDRKWILSDDAATLTVRVAVTSFGATTNTVRVFKRR
jgi:hypothetical protein